MVRKSYTLKLSHYLTKIKITHIAKTKIGNIIKNLTTKELNFLGIEF